MNTVYLALPCYNLEDFSLVRTDYEVREILSAWLAAFDPELILWYETAPAWISAWSPYESPHDDILLIPSCAQSGLDYSWLEQRRLEGCKVFDATDDIESQVNFIKDSLKEIAADKRVKDGIADDDPNGPAIPVFADPDSLSDLQRSLKREFQAVALGYMQSEAITRRMRYMSCLDTEQFRRMIVLAAEGWRDNDETKCREGLQKAVDAIIQSKEYYFPTENYLLDYIVVSSKKHFPQLVDILNQLTIPDSPYSTLKPSFFMTGKRLEQFSEEYPDSFQKLLELTGTGTTTLVSGEYVESPLPLMPPEGVLDRFYDALYRFKQLTNRPLLHYGRLECGLTPLLPGILKRLGFEAALHFCMDSGHVPQPDKSKMVWEGLDGYEIQAVSQVPLDANSPEKIFVSPEIVAERADNDYTLAVLFAHKPAPLPELSNGLFDLMRLGARYGALVGNFSTLKSYLDNTRYSGEHTYYDPENYDSPLLGKWVEKKWTDPLSRWTRYYSLSALLTTVGTLESLAAALTKTFDRDPVSESYSALNDAIREKTFDQSGLNERLLPEVSARLTEAAEKIARKAFGKSAWEQSEQAKRTNPAAAPSGFLAINPLPWTVRQTIDVSGLESTPDQADPVKKLFPESKQAVVEIPSCGFAWIPAGSGQAPPEKKSWLGRLGQVELDPLAEETTLRNEFFELSFDPATGMLLGVYDYKTHGTRFAQQLAYRLGSPRVLENKDDSMDYSISVADRFESSCDDYSGRLTIFGRLVDREAQTLCEFEQTVTVKRRSRVIDFNVKLNPVQEPDERPWKSYVACRWAWPDGAAVVSQSVGWAALETSQREMVAPSFIDIRTEKKSLTILPGGLSYHRLLGDRRLDTLLLVQGETQREFNWSIAVDVDDPARAAQEYWTQPVCVPGFGAGLSPRQPTAWLVDFDVPNLQITSAFAETDQAEIPDSSGNTIDSAESAVPPELAASSEAAASSESAALPAPRQSLILRIQEVSGEKTETLISFFKPAKSAQIDDFRGQKLRALDIDCGRVALTLPAFGWEEIRVDF